jgi:hypothetical protein
MAKSQLTILDPKYDKFYQSFRMVFDLNGDDYTFYSDKDHTGQVDCLICNHFYHPNIGMDPADIIKKYNYRKSFFLDTKHNSENQIELWNRRCDASLHDFTITNAIDLNITNDKIIYYDFLFNRTKAYYLGYPWQATDLWYYSSKLSYQIPSHSLPELKSKLYVSPSNSHLGERKFRSKLVDVLLTKYSNLGYIGDSSRGITLHCQLNCIDATSVDDLYSRASTFLIGGYDPPHTEYYKDTFISIYAETIEYGNSFAPTEKTFDPLIKGHFILPFSNCGFITYIKNTYDFQFPNFIDYSYDSIADDNTRFYYYSQELERLMNLDISLWREYWINNQDIIKHNQQIFYDRPYHRIDFSQYLK